MLVKDTAVGPSYFGNNKAAQWFPTVEIWRSGLTRNSHNHGTGSNFLLSRLAVGLIV
jgi:hypothetical protein